LSVDRPRQARGRREGRALAAPVARLQKEMQAAVTTGLAETPGLPRAMGLRLIRALPGDRLSCPRHSRKRLDANSTSAPGGRDHTTSPSARTRSSAPDKDAARPHGHRSPPRVS
jgi:hypothetical protein